MLLTHCLSPGQQGQAAVTNYHRWSDFNNTHLFLMVLEAGSLRWVPVRSGSGEGPLLVYRPLSSCFLCRLSRVFFFLMFVFERERAWVREGQRERETEDPKQTPHWQQRAWYGARTYEPWDHDQSRSQTINWANKATPENFIFKPRASWKRNISLMSLLFIQP